MKIGNPAPTVPALPAASAPAAADPGKATASAPLPQAVPAAAADPSAKVELSSTASTLLSSGASGEFDSDKVDRISHAIGSGTFQIDANKIADKLISNAQELLVKVQG